MRKSWERKVPEILLTVPAPTRRQSLTYSRRAQLNARVDAIYVAASSRDSRFTRICVASIRFFYPRAPVRLLAGGPLEPGLVDELARYWDTPLACVKPGDWGWGFVKLEPLFGPEGERFLVVDSDTVFAGRVLENWAACNAGFLVDDEQQTEVATRRLYYDWRQVLAVDPAATPPQFVFNSGQWFGTAGLLSRRDFEMFIDWRNVPPRLRYPGLFMPGDQGVLNYVLNRKVACEGLAVNRGTIMRWPGHGMDGVNAETVASGTAPPVIVHWAGYKGPRLGSLPGADVLRFFEAEYYTRLPSSRARRVIAAVRHPLGYWARHLAVRLKARFRPLKAKE
jgi:hypothetical protein